MKKTIKHSILLASILGLTACSYSKKTFHNRADDYRKATSIPALKIPEGVSQTSMTPYYPIPHEEKASAKPVDLYPPDVT